MGPKKPRNSIAPPRRKPSRPTDLDAVLDQFSDGLSMLAVAAKALAQGQTSNDEQVCLAAAVKLLNGAYAALDEAIVGMAS
jgi:hypothetical protein